MIEHIEMVNSATAELQTIQTGLMNAFAAFVILAVITIIIPIAIGIWKSCR
jgi:hypothetical protein